MAEAGQRMESGSFERELQVLQVLKLLQNGWQVPVSGLVGSRSSLGQPTEAGQKDCWFETLWC
jgi:hypothetical protein